MPAMQLHCAVHLLVCTVAMQAPQRVLLKRFLTAAVVHSGLLDMQPLVTLLAQQGAGQHVGVLR